jgi:hypothetical protein
LSRAGKLSDRVEPIAGDGQCFWSAPEQLRGNLLAADLKCEFSIDRIGAVASPPPDSATFTRRCHLGVRVASHIEVILRPDVNRVRTRVAAVIQIDRGEWIRLGHYEADAVSFPGLHRRHSGRTRCWDP